MEEIGIVGLTNVGKSSLFNALNHRRLAEVADRPFTTIEPNISVVSLPDRHLLAIRERLSPEAKAIPATLKIVDIAGLIEGASHGLGLGNQFLAKIREVEAIWILLRGFSGQSEKITPRDQLKIILAELEAADRDHPQAPSLLVKPRLIVLNLDQEELGRENRSLAEKYQLAGENPVAISAKLESEMTELSAADQTALLRELSLERQPCDQLLEESKKLLSLVAFYTLKADQVQAWLIKRGTRASLAAEKVHSEIGRGLIRVEVLSLEDFLTVGSFQTAKIKGLIRSEGRDYEIKESEIVLFRFNR